jgi:hypothetical protein
MIVGFGPDGRQMWAMHVGLGVCALSLGTAGARLALAHPPDGVVLAQPRAGRSKLNCGFPASSVVLLEEGRPQILVAGPRGDVALLDAGGRPLWHHKVQAASGPVRASARADMVTLPALQEGVQAFTLDGAGAGAFDVGEPVTGAVPAASPIGTVLAVLTAGGQVLLIDLDGTILWESGFEARAGAVEMTADGSLLAVALADGRIVACKPRFEAAMEGQAVKTLHAADRPSAEPPAGETRAVADPEALRHELLSGLQLNVELEEPGAAAAPAAVLAGKARLEQGRPPTSREELVVSPLGAFAAMALGDGRVMVTDMAGVVLAAGGIPPSARLVRRRSEALLAAWSPAALIVLSPVKRKTQTVALEQLKVRLFDCSERVHAATALTQDGDLLMLRPTGEVTARAPVDPAPWRLMMSPDGQTVVTEDDELRLRFFDSSGRQLRKQRFHVEERFEHMILENAFCAFGSNQGRVVLQDLQGKVASRRKVVDRVVRLESLETAVAVYDAGGQCLIMAPHGNVLMAFAPPPGDCLVRMPRSGSPLVLHSRGPVLTALTGRGAGLEPLWRFECPGEIITFDADRDGRQVAVATSDRIYFVRAPEG